MRNTIFMSCNGLHLGEWRGHHPKGPPLWWTAAGGVIDSDYRQNAMWGWFVPGKDIRVPCQAYFYVNNPMGAGPAQLRATALPPDPFGRCRQGWAWDRNRTRVYFEGSVTRPDSDDPWDHNARLEVVDRFRGTPGWAVRDSRQGPRVPGGRQDQTPGLDWNVHKAQFCVAPDGNDGGWGGRDMEAISSGCIALYVNDNTSRYMEELLPHESFTIDVTEARIPSMEDVLDAAQAQLPRMQRQAWCGCKALMATFSGRYPDFHMGWDSPAELRLQESRGAFALLMRTLRLRLEREAFGKAAGRPPEGELVASATGASPTPMPEPGVGLGAGYGACDLPESGGAEGFADDLLFGLSGTSFPGDPPSSQVETPPPLLVHSADDIGAASGRDEPLGPTA